MKKNFLLVMLLAIALTACGDHKKGQKHQNMTPPPEPEMAKPMNDTQDQILEVKSQEPETMMAKSSKYEAYSADKMAELKGNQKFAVFFHADWCGTCVKWEGKTAENLVNLPENTVILKADYDTETELVKDLHVKKQSTAVFFDSSGEIVDAISDPSQEVLADFFSSEDNDIMAATGDKYMDFDQAQYEAMKGTEKMIVFFHADWCGTCRKWEANLQDNINTVADNAKILKADYDTDRALVKEYEITKQSTAVFINADGTVAKKEGDPSLESVNEFFAQ